LHGKNDHIAYPALSLSLLSISLSISSSASYSSQKTSSKVIISHSIISRLWVHPNQSEDEAEENEAPDAHLLPETDIACVEWLLD
jgi:hypothetical protein